MWPSRPSGSPRRRPGSWPAPNARRKRLCRPKRWRWPILRSMSDAVYPAFAEVLGGQKPTIKVRSMVSRWGVCAMAKRQITFALQLYNMPPAAQIYVVVHEYCHFLQPNHGRAFWAEVEKLLPDWKARRELLK